MRRQKIFRQSRNRADENSPTRFTETFLYREVPYLAVTDCGLFNVPYTYLAVPEGTFRKARTL